MSRVKILVVILLLTTFALAKSNLPFPKEGTTVYVIKPSDTLSGISQKFYGNAFYWPRLWGINSYIDNPHLIYPGDSLSLTNLPLVKLGPKTHEETLKDIMPPHPVYYYAQARSEGFVAKGHWKNLGSIVSSEPLKILLGKGDHVYLNVGSDFGFSPGDAFTVFRSTAPVIHPVTGKTVGYKVAILGEIEILSILGKNQSYGVITASYREITRGAKIIPLEPFVSEVVMRKGERHVEGLILESKNDVVLNGTGSVVYIDVGKNDNIVAGHTFSIFQHVKRVHDFDSGKKVTIPGVNIGQLVVLRVEENTSTGVIIKSSRQIEPGDLVVLDI